MTKEVDKYIERLDPEKVDIVTKLRSRITSKFPQLSEEFKWNMPVYTFNNQDIAYLQATKQGVNLGFNKGAQLDDPQRFLEGTGKNMRHIKIHDLNSFDIEHLEQLLTQAVKTN